VDWIKEAPHESFHGFSDSYTEFGLEENKLVQLIVRAVLPQQSNCLVITEFHDKFEINVYAIKDTFLTTFGLWEGLFGETSTSASIPDGRSR
jgi:hypothetical protein